MLQSPKSKVINTFKTINTKYSKYKVIKPETQKHVEVHMTHTYSVYLGRLSTLVTTNHFLIQCKARVV